MRDVAWVEVVINVLKLMSKILNGKLKFQKRSIILKIESERQIENGDWSKFVHE